MIVRWTALGAFVLMMTAAGIPPALAADDPPQPWTKPVPRATCGPGSRAETGLQGSSTLAERFGGATAQGFSCNMQLVGQDPG